MNNDESIVMDFVQPVFINTITTFTTTTTAGDDDNSVVVIHHMNNDSFTYDGTELVEPVVVSSMAVSAGGISTIDYCFEPCPEALAKFEDNADAIDAEPSDKISLGLATAGVSCIHAMDIGLQLIAMPIRRRC